MSANSPITLVAFAIRPGKNPFSLHFVQSPLSVVFPAVSPLVATLAFDVVVLEASNVRRAISPFEYPLSFLLP
jgi:hypothetical protein